MISIRKIFSIIFFHFLFSLLCAAPFQKSLEPGTKQSVVYVKSCDWGACVEKIVINAGRPISPQIVRAKDFEVNQILYPKSTNVGMIKGALSVVDAFSSDSLGNKLASPSEFVTILTDVHPEAENSSPFVSISLGGRFQSYYGYKIKNSELSLTITELKGFVNENAAKFTTDSFSYKISATDEEKTNPNYEEKSLILHYAAFIPESEEKIPLIIWFHGMGEGGTNPYEVLFGTKTTALAGEQIQSHFENGAAILAPQSPTGWLESSQKGAFGIHYWAPIDKDTPINKVKKPFTNFLNKFFTSRDTPKEEKMPFAAVSFYTEPVKKLLFTFLAEHPQIDRSRIYVGGCSAGGYMTMNMMIQNPELFAAAFPICEYYLDSKITVSQIKNLAEKPLWFTYALNDGRVNPEKNSIPTVKRLKEYGAQNLHESVFRSVVDLSGAYLLNPNAKIDDNDFGLPYEYDGHYSWIYVLNDQCKDGSLNLFDWLSAQKL